MNKKYITVGLTCSFIMIAGICYSCTFSACSPKSALSSSLSGEEETKLTDTDHQSQSKIPSISPTISVDSSEMIQDSSNLSTIYVHICGAVINPGVYQSEQGARICDLIKMSGGLKEDAAGDYINQAEQAIDGQRIYIPTLKEVENLTADEYITGGLNASTNAEETSGLIDINTASVEELMTLPGIGQAKADSIIEYRSTNGKFKSIEDLMSIPGIKEGVFKRLSSYITTE